MDRAVSSLSRRHFVTGLLAAAAAPRLLAPLGAFALPLSAPRPAAAGTVTGAVPHEPVSRTFNVFLGKERIGFHRFSIIPGAATGDWDVAVDIDMKVDLFLFGEVVYVHSSREAWRQGRIVELTSSTDDDGDLYQVSGAAAGDHFTLRGEDGEVEAPGSLVTSNTVWSEAICREKRIIDATMGAVVGLRATPDGSRTATTDAGEETARAYDVACPMIKGSFWYDEAGLWMRSSLIRGRTKIDYFLDS